MSQQIAPVICDCCGADITSTTNCEEYRLVLRSEAKMPQFVRDGKRFGTLTAMADPPEIEGQKDFCGLACLNKWLRKLNNA